MTTAQRQSPRYSQWRQRKQRKEVRYTLILNSLSWHQFFEGGRSTISKCELMLCLRWGSLLFPTRLQEVGTDRFFTPGKKPGKPNKKADNAAKATLRGVRTTLRSIQIHAINILRNRFTQTRLAKSVYRQPSTDRRLFNSPEPRNTPADPSFMNHVSTTTRSSSTHLTPRVL